MTQPSVTQLVLDRCRDAMFTGIVRVRSRQAEGEVWFLSGILEWQKFGVSLGEEAMERLLAATDVHFEVLPCLPTPGGGFRRRTGASSLAMEGKLGDTLPVDLLRFCEAHALTCRVELARGRARGEAIYRLGELLQIRCDTSDAAPTAGRDPAVAEMLEWSEGDYRLVLPTVELPDGLSPSTASTLLTETDDADVPPVTEAAAWRKALNEAVKRKAEAVIAKRGVPGEPTALPPPSAPEPVSQLVPVASKPKTAKRGKRPGPVLLRVRRTVIEEAYIRVPVADALLLPANAEGERAIDNEGLRAEALRRAAGARVGWRPESPPIIVVHPTQTPPPPAVSPRPRAAKKTSTRKPGK